MCAFDRPPPAPPQTYALGKGREADAWAKTVHSSAPHLPYERPEGNRQDGVLDGSVPLFWNKQRTLEFLQALKVPGADNKLENFLLTVLSCNEMTAALRVNVLWKYIFSEPARWLTGKAGELGWGLDDSSELLDAIYDMMQAVAADGRRLLDPAYDPFASFAAKYPEFAAWRTAHAKEELKAADGTSYPIHAMVLAEAREPTRAGNIQCEARVITLAEEMAEAALFAMRDPRRSISSMLVSQGGKFAVGADPGRNAATAGAHATNDRVESNFGCLDILMRMWRHATVESVSGMAQQMRMHDFDRPPNTLHDRRKRKHAAQAHSGGYFYSGLTERQRESLVEFARLEVASARDAGRQALKAQAAEKLERREERVTVMLNKAVERYAYAKELFAAWAAPGGQRATSALQVAKALHDGKPVPNYPHGRPKPEAQQLEYLRYQIEMRVLGLGWSEYATRWSSAADSRIGTVAHLTKLLEELIKEETARKRFPADSVSGLPTEAAPPQLAAGGSTQLGTLDADAVVVRSTTRFNSDELKRKAEAEVERRIAAGISDDTEWRQPEEAPAFDSALVGKRLEVCRRSRVE